MPVQGSTDGLVQQLLDRLERLSQRLSKTVVITSGRRTGDINASAHNSGIAADFYVAGMNSIALADEVADDGFTGVGEYYKADSTEERFAHADIRGLPGSENSGAYGPGGSKSAPLCWYRIGEQYTYGSRKSGHRCPRRTMTEMVTSLANVDPDAPDAERVRVMRTIIAQVVDDLDSSGLENKKKFLLHVAWHEGAFLKKRVQVGGGPGRSFFQMEPPRSWDAFDWAERNRWLERLTSSSGLTEAELRSAARDLPREPGRPWPSGNLIEAKLGGAFDLFGVYMARIALKRLSQPIGTSNRDHAVYWADHWKIDFPDGDRDELIDRFEREANQVDRTLQKQLLAGVGTCINSTGEVLLVYGTKSPSTPQNRDNALYQLPPNRKTPPGWDCDGIYVPNDRTGDQLVGEDKPGPVAVKYGLGPADTSFEITMSGNKYKLPANQGVFTPAEVCTPSDWPTCVNWDVPNISHIQVNTYPVVPGHIPR